MEIVLAVAIGVLTGSGVWLLLRPRTYQVIMGLALLSYAVNLFIFIMGRVWLDKPPFTPAGSTPDPSTLADPLPQALVHIEAAGPQPGLLGPGGSLPLGQAHQRQHLRLAVMEQRPVGIAGEQR